MSKTKEYAVFFIDVSGMQSYVVAAKCKQMSDWMNINNPFGSKYNVIIIPSNENKVCLLKTNKEFLNEFHGDSLEWLSNVRDKLEDCLTINLLEKDS